MRIAPREKYLTSNLVAKFGASLRLRSFVNMYHSSLGKNRPLLLILSSKGGRQAFGVQNMRMQEEVSI